MEMALALLVAAHEHVVLRLKRAFLRFLRTFRSTFSTHPNTSSAFLNITHQ
jgi:hypothetical protein